MSQHHVFTQDVHRARQAADKAKSDLDKAKVRRDRFARFDPGKVEAEIERIELRLSILHKDIADRSAQEDRLSAEIRGLEQNMNSLFNPRNWFDTEQRCLRKERGIARRKQASCPDTNTRSRKDIDELVAKRAHLEMQLMEHAEAMREDLDEVVRGAERVLERKSALQTGAEVRKSAFDREAAPLLEQIEDYEDEIDSLEQHIALAREYEEALSEAENGYERAQVHEACEEHIGYSSPRKAIHDYRNKLRSLKRNLKKTRDQLDLRVKRSRRTIHHLVIDGSNLCYEDSREHSFVGLRPLQALLPKLVSDYEVTVVFDANIRSLLKMSDAAIRSRFPGKVRTHITANRAKADPILLRIADSDRYAFAISNDRFTDFPDSDADRSRVLRHEIVAGRVIIDELDVDTPFE